MAILTLKHIKDIIAVETIQLIRDESFAAEQQGSLTPAMLAVIYKHNWLRIMVPKACGGLEWSLPEIVQLLEAVAYADGNFGWTLNLCAGANLFAGYMPPDTALEIFANPHACIAGSGAVTGTATRSDDGYILNGRWKYATGSAHASFFSANCYLANENGIINPNKLFKSFVIPVDDVAIIPAWNGVGMMATSSHDFEVKNVFVPEYYSFSLMEASRYADGSLYRFPFILLAVFNITVMSTGLAMRFLELFTDLAQQKKFGNGKELIELDTVSNAIDKHTQKLEKARTAFYTLLNESWIVYERKEAVDEQFIQRARAAAVSAAAVSRALVNELYSMGGMSVLQKDTEINKVWRDFSVASQHNIVSPLLST